MADLVCPPIKKPIVGVFIKPSHLGHFYTHNTNTRLEAIINACRKTQITLYYFSLNDVDLKRKSISGTYYNETTSLWEKGKFPYPHVLYARGGSIKQRQKYDIFHQQLEALGVKRINSGPVFNKWDVLKILGENSTLMPHLPFTIVYATAADLMQMLSKYGEVYLKACRGRKGMQVIRVKKIGTDSFEYRYYRKNKLNKGLINFSDLILLIEKFYYQRPFLIQQAINLPRLHGSIYDMRAEMQRNGEGELEIVEILVRVSQPGLPITIHASSFLFDDFFAKGIVLPREQINTIRNAANVFLNNVYLTIEKAYGPYGEIGIDFAIDQAGHLWFIECNSRSTKVSLFNAAGKEKKERSYLNPFSYAKFLYNQAIKQLDT